MRTISISLLDFGEDIELNLEYYEAYVLGLISQQVPKGTFIRFAEVLRNGKLRTGKWTGEIPA